MKSLKVKGEIVLATGVYLDMMSTIIGITYFNVSESNIAGLPMVLMLNISLMLCCMFTFNLKRHWIVDILLYLVGLFRFLVFIHNIFILF